MRMASRWAIVVVFALACLTVSACAHTSTTASDAARTLVATGRSVDAATYVTGSWAPNEPARPMPHVVQFTTPSGNIRCTMTSSVPAELMCAIDRYDFAPPARPATCQLNWATGLLDFSGTSATLGQCVGGPQVTYSSKVLSYGSTLTAQGFACYSGSDALTCVKPDTGHGFAVSRAALRTF